MSNRTKAAESYVGSKRREGSEVATWFDVAEAYDAGLKHALFRPEHAHQQLMDSGAMVLESASRRLGKK